MTEVRFGHHPDALIDYGVEIERLSGLLCEARAGLFRALDYRAATPEVLGIKQDIRDAIRRTAPSAHPEVDRSFSLSAAEASGLDRLTRAVRRELAGTEYERVDLAWILEAGLWQLGRIIRDGQPITLPALGTFRRHPMTIAPDSERPRYLVSFEPDEMLLEAAL